ncbi:hypothetical protein [Amycolatopsis sp. WGS_07]|uniref:hypothetical protein n=1 Tax=Amycolatopsis sp. WGS_07 TaxID=3076764 RepID=UPI003873BC07
MPRPRSAPRRRARPGLRRRHGKPDGTRFLRRLALAACAAALAAACSVPASAQPGHAPDARAVARRPHTTQWQCRLPLAGLLLAVADSRCDAQPLPRALSILRHARRTLARQHTTGTPQRRD